MEGAVPAIHVPLLLPLLTTPLQPTPTPALQAPNSFASYVRDQFAATAAGLPPRTPTREVMKAISAK